MGTSGNKLQLPTVTLMCIDCVDPYRAAAILDHCKTKADFGAVKLLTDSGEYKIPRLTSLVMYSIFMLTKVHEYIDTEHVLIVQRDGWILNPQSFDYNWLKLDYIGPLFMQYDKVGSGGFSLRSKKLMQFSGKTAPYWDGSEEQAVKIQATLGQYEDGTMSFFYPKIAEFNIATKEQASYFAQGGNRNPKYFHEYPFGFHRTWQEIDFKTGRVDSSDTKKDIHVTYDYEIDTL